MAKKQEKKKKDYSKVYTTSEDIAEMYAEITDATTPKAIRRARFGKFVGLIGKLLLALFLAAVCFVVVEVRLMRDQGESPTIFGYSVYNVLTGSMIPTLPVDSVFLAEEYDGQPLNVGDIVVFISRDGRRITHRIVEKGTDENGVTYYRTKGDNPQNSVDADPLYEENIEAVFLTRLYLF